MSFKIAPNSGLLTKVNSTVTPAAPVNSVLYTSPHNGTSKQLLAVAHYAWGLTTYVVDPDTATFELSQTFNFTMSKPGPNAARQAAPHPHQVILDPTKKYFLVPDLGADLVRVFHIDSSSLQITEKPSIPVAPGSGPRHGVFQSVNYQSVHHSTGGHNSTVCHNSTGGHKSTGGQDAHYFFLVTELANTVTSYYVMHMPNNTGLTLHKRTSLKTYGSHNESIFASNAAAEIAIADGKQLIVSNRNATFFHISNPDPKNTTNVPSDTLATFDIAGGDGKMRFCELSPAGGSFPRQFSINKRQDLVAVGLQNSGLVAIFSRDLRTGTIGNKILASVEIEGEVTSVVWGDE